MKILKKYKYGFFFIFLGLLSLLIFRLKDTHVNSNGILVEPFALIPIGWILILVGMTSFFLVILKKK